MRNLRLILISCFTVMLFTISIAVAEPYDGYTFYTPNNSTHAYLVDMNGDVAHSWNSTTTGGYSAYLLENGHMLRSAVLNNATLRGAAYAGKVQEIDWEGNLVWEFVYNSTTYTSHHDIEPMPNGNVLLIAWELKSSTEAGNAGRQNPRTMWPDHIVEVEPDGNGGGSVIWEWHVWDHLIQDYNASANNYGVVEDHPELIDINLGTFSGGPGGGGGDWMHMNGLDYNEELDQIVFSSHFFDEIYIIDHSTTTAEAASHSGGNAGMGGDILYRWGNPSNYGATGETYFDVCHCSVWVPDDCPGAGNVLVFNNNEGAHASTIPELVLPIEDDGSYTITPGSAFGPAEPTWEYSNGSTFYSNHLGSVQRLPNGNTLLAESVDGNFLEVESDGTIVWEYDANQQVPRVLRYGVDYPGLSALFPVDYDNIAINEVLLINTNIVSDQDDEYDPWIEIYNYGEEDIPLNGCYLGESVQLQSAWSFPDITISPGSFVIIWMDGDTGQEGLHTSFAASSDDDVFYLLNPDGDVIDVINLPDQTENISYGRYPDGTGDFTAMTPSYGIENNDGIIPANDNIAINELLLINTNVASDQDDEFDPWIEIYNYGEENVALNSYYLGESAQTQTGWAFPDTTIAQGSFIIIWLDGDTDQSGLHTSFAASSEDDVFYLFDSDGEVLDVINLPAQAENISYGRYPDGTGDFIAMLPSFGYENNDGMSGIVDTNFGQLNSFRIISNYPNPFNPQTSIKFELTETANVQLSVYNISGQLVKTLLSGNMEPGIHDITWDGRSLAGKLVGSGTYFCVLKSGNNFDTRKMLLLK